MATAAVITGCSATADNGSDPKASAVAAATPSASASVPPVDGAPAA